MKFLAGKLPGKVNYVTYLHNNVAGTDAAPRKRSFELSKATDDSSCRISFHWRDENGSGTINDKDGEILLKQVREITTMPLDQRLQQELASSGHPEWSVKLDPPVFSVVVNRSNAKPFDFFDFYNETLAERVGKALQHAADLCGGGNQEPF